MTYDSTDPTTALDRFDGGAPIEPLISESLITCPADASARDVAERLHDAGVGFLVIGDADHVEAVVSERDIVRAVARGDDLDGTIATEIGNREPRWIASTAGVAEAIDEMMTGYHRHLLVRNHDGALVGVLSVRDLLAAYPG